MRNNLPITGLVKVKPHNVLRSHFHFHSTRPQCHRHKAGLLTRAPRIKLLFDSDICSFGHIHLTLVVKDALFVLGIHRGRRGSVELGTILSAELSIFGFFFIDDFLTSCNHISIDLADRFISLNCLGEVLRGSFFSRTLKSLTRLHLVHHCSK